MARWEPNARDRLAQAAMDLYGERGFENTTVAEIAERAGLTERTFFRHFADKREVLFGGGHALEELVVSAVAEAPRSLAPLDAAVAGFEAAGQFFVPERREFAHQRQAIIAANPELQERELIKLASLSSALAEALGRRGLDDQAASLTAEIATSVFRAAFARWINEHEQNRDFSQIVRESLEQLKALTVS